MGYKSALAQENDIQQDGLSQLHHRQLRTGSNSAALFIKPEASKLPFDSLVTPYLEDIATQRVSRMLRYITGANSCEISRMAGRKAQRLRGRLTQ